MLKDDLKHQQRYGNGRPSRCASLLLGIVRVRPLYVATLAVAVQGQGAPDLN
jgi:hypothetical protein